MPNLQVKDVPDDVYAELRRRAALSHSSLRDYVLRLLRRDQEVPPRQEWLARVAALAPVHAAGPAAEDLASIREERS